MGLRGLITQTQRHWGGDRAQGAHASILLESTAALEMEGRLLWIPILTPKMSTKRTMNCKEAERQFIWGLRIAIRGPQILEEPRIVSHWKKITGFLIGKRGQLT